MPPAKRTPVGRPGPKLGEYRELIDRPAERLKLSVKPDKNAVMPVACFLLKG